MAAVEYANYQLILPRRTILIILLFTRRTLLHVVSGLYSTVADSVVKSVIKSVVGLAVEFLVEELPAELVLQK